ncbi:MAG: sulfite exporter TauE/SafE family protein [Chloroflexi bacterium]|nr:sulfite exporter TauE/SafE family protein [Chloroflexota bacterium]
MENVEWYVYLAVIAAGFGAGFINTLAGSGSLITLPLLIFLGLPANVANGTNRVGVLFQNVISTNSFRRQKVLDARGGIILSIPAIIGSLIGAQIAVELDETLMRQVIGILMVIMLVVILLRPKQWLQGELERMGERPSPSQLLLFFAIGIYGGFIQAGVGIFLLAGLVLDIGYDLVRANPVKNMIVLLFTISALIVFVLNDQVVWSIGLILAIGNSLGAWVAAQMAVERGAHFVRWVLIVVVAVSAANLLGVFSWLGSLF